MKVQTILIGAGILLIIVGALWTFLPFGKLPLDIAIHKKNVSFYFPIGTSLLLSIILTLLFLAFSLFRRHF